MQASHLAYSAIHLRQVDEKTDLQYRMNRQLMAASHVFQYWLRHCTDSLSYHLVRRQYETKGYKRHGSTTFPIASGGLLAR
jgi:hypothetical protein